MTDEYSVGAASTVFRQISKESFRNGVSFHKFTGSKCLILLKRIAPSQEVFETTIFQSFSGLLLPS